MFNYYGYNIDCVVEWTPSLYCKNNCFYCPQRFIRESDPLAMRNDLLKNIDLFLNFFNKRGKFAILLSGGEPFAFDGFMELVKGLTKKHYLMLHTSLTEDISEFVSNINPKKVIFIRCGLHPKVLELDVNNKEFSTFYDRVKILKRKGFKPIVCVPCRPEIFSMLPSIYDIFSKINVAVEPTVYISTEDYTQYDISCVKKLMCTNVGIKQISYKSNIYTGKMCDTGWRDIVINYDGSITRCWHDKISSWVGNLYSDTLNLYDRPMPCVTTEPCGCRNYYYDEVCIKDGSKSEMKKLIKGFVKPFG
jgi:MoaA/NifB/PqqE/SkfB family radical SAM enzyme